MKISAVQLQPATGNIESNIAKHLTLVDASVRQGADLVFFPELSLTGYEPALAQTLATEKADQRLNVFQQRSDEHKIVIGVGLPISVESGVQIGMIWFTPNRPRRCYAKQQLHADELPFFVAGDEQLVLEISAEKIAPAICYESLQPDHAKQAAELGASVYLASVAKPAGGMKKGVLHYPEIAKQQNMCVIMADSVGPCDDFVSVGQSAAWNGKGELLAQMDSQSEGFLLLDTVDERAVVCKFRGV
ncbi:MAG: carbon-nitrogen hydrolase family protein [Cyanobacteria bacterium J06614_10]